MPFEPLHVQKILFPSGSTLVLNQVFSRQNGNDLVCKRRLQSRGPRIREIHAINCRDHIDANRSDANLKDRTGNREV